MANSPRRSNNRARRALACCLGLLGAAAAMVDVHRDNTAMLRDVVITQGETRIEAAEAFVKGGLDFENGEWTVSGNVRIRAEGGNLRADKAVVRFRNNLISRATITGTPAEFEQLRKDGSTSRGRAPTIDYETAIGTVSFRDNAWLSDGCNEITAKELVYNIKAQSVQGQTAGSSMTPGSDGRVRIVIQPQAQSGKPCNAPQAAP